MYACIVGLHVCMHAQYECMYMYMYMYHVYMYLYHDNATSSHMRMRLCMILERSCPKPRPSPPPKQASGGIWDVYCARRQKVKISVSYTRDATTEDYGGFVFALFPQKLASRIYETLMFEFAPLLHQKTSVIWGPKLRKFFSQSV